MKRFLLLILPAIALAGCRKDDGGGGSDIVGGGGSGTIEGFFLLNEGGWNAGNSTLDYYDYQTGEYSRNIFGARNPHLAIGQAGLGSTGNDLQIYGSRLYAVMNGSNLVEVMDVNTVAHIGTADVTAGRYIVFDGAYAYVSSYSRLQPDDPRGCVAKVDTASLEVVARCAVGRQPEQMAVVGGKLYVANSGGYMDDDAGTYETSVSVVDLATFTETRRIEVGLNNKCIAADGEGRLWVSSTGDYGQIPSDTFVVDPATDQVTAMNGLPCSNMWLHGGDSLYVYSAQWSYATSDWTISYALLNTATRSVISDNYITDGTQTQIQMPYGIAVNPVTGEFFVTDSRDSSVPGNVICYSAAGTRKWTVGAGVAPSRIAFTTRRLQPIE